ncbi:hypothetical protein GWO13_09945, partial [Candidatus Bathyarchaeota archaeon]|nr:hypothetical protein [Candidatus Bathyarchaeota archaeon]NIW15256.1 hypothetical protein [Candidatus Thorarchaeota archaeon]
MSKENKFLQTKTPFDTGNGQAHLYSLKKLEEMGYGNISKLPFTIRILLEAVLREYDGYVFSENDVDVLANYNAKNPEGEIPFKPSRV